MHVLGVDAGGSRTTAIVADGAGRELACGEGGPGAIRPGLLAAAVAAIALACRDALQRARVVPPVEALCVGASGAGQEPERAALEAELRTLGLAALVRVTTDAEIALQAAFGTDPGVMLIAGTGSVAWARFPDGSLMRAGGLGPLLGDQGSAWDVAREGLRAAAAGLEVGAPPEARRLLDRVLNRLSLDAAALPRWSLSATVPEVVTLAPIIAESGRDGDPTARAILRRAADALADTALALLRQLPADAPARLAWSGGFLSGSSYYRGMVFERLRAGLGRVEILDGPVEAARGAVDMATGERGDRGMGVR